MSNTKKSLKKQLRKVIVARKKMTTQLAATELLSELVDKLPEGTDRIFGHRLLLKLIESL